MFNITCSFPAEISMLQRKAHPIFKVGYHPNGILWMQAIQDVKDPDKPETWLFQQFLSWVGTPRPEGFPDQASKQAFWKEKAKLFADPWRSAGEHIPDDLQFGVDRITSWKPSMDWTKSDLWPHATLGGDAAHSMPPHRDQGLNNALEDAAKLVDELTAASKGEKSLEEAVVEYKKEMKARALKEVSISVMQAQMAHRWDQLMQSPLFQSGMHKYKEDMAASNKPIEVATDVHVR
jgi:2-polyprenyl-6-methoxyphenol hydroxylase-like FAD-dependent oxidoreductase